MYLLEWIKGALYLKVGEFDCSLKSNFTDINELVIKINEIKDYKITCSNQNSIVVTYNKNIFDFGVHIVIKLIKGNMNISVRRSLLKNIRLNNKATSRIIDDLTKKINLWKS